MQLRSRRIVNCVNSTDAVGVSAAHGREGARSGRPQTVIKRPDQTRFRVGTVNVGTLSKRSGEVAETISRRNIDACSLQETRWKGTGARRITGKDTRPKLFWSGNNDGTGGVGIIIAEKWIDKVVDVAYVSSRLLALKLLVGTTILNIIAVYAPQQNLPSTMKDAFYTVLISQIAKAATNEITIVAGDLNGHVGKSARGYEQVHGGFGYGTRNREGDRILDFCSAGSMVVTNTNFKKPTNHLITYKSGKNKTQIDYILISSTHKHLVKDVKVIPREEIFPQHRLVVCDLNIKMPKVKKKPFIPKLRVWKLREPTIRALFALEIKKFLHEPSTATGVEGIWTRLESALNKATDATCGKTKGRMRRKITWWWNDVVEKAIKLKRDKWKQSTVGECSDEEYKEAKLASQKAVYIAKEGAEAEEFADLSTDKDSRNNAFKVANQIRAESKDVIGDPCIKNDQGQKVFSEKDKLEAWKEHYERLLNEEFPWDPNHLIMGKPVQGPAPWIAIDQVTAGLAKMKDGKAAGCSGITTEMMKASGEDGITLITELINAIIYEEATPTDWDMSSIINCYKGKGDATERGNYRGLKLLEHPMKLLERILEQHIRKTVNIDDMQFGFMPGKGTMEAIFIVRQIQEKFIAKKRDVFFTFVDLEKAFDRVPRAVLKWALREAGVEEWIINVVMAMYLNCKSTVSINGEKSEAFEVKVGVHQGSVLSPLLFILAMEMLSKNLRTGLPWEVLYADDLVLIADSLQELENKYTAWKHGMESKGLRVNTGKTKVMKSQRGIKTQNKSGNHPCGVCLQGVSSNSILCPSCKCWVHKRCSGVKGPLSKVVGFICSKCRNGPSVQDQQTPTHITMAGDNLEVTKRFCYLGDMLDAGGGSQSSAITRTQCGWKKFRELLPLLTSKATTRKLKGQLYKACVQTVMLYGSETWAPKAEDEQRLHRNEMSMLKWMDGSSSKSKLTNTQLFARFDVTPITDRMCSGRLRWLGHTERCSPDNWVRKVQDLEVPGDTPTGAPPKSWSKTIEKDLKVKGVARGLALDRDAWRLAIASGKV